MCRVLSEANLGTASLEAVAVSVKAHFSKADFFRVANALVRLSLYITHIAFIQLIPDCYYILYTVYMATTYCLQCICM